MAIGKTFSRLGVFPNFPLISLHDLFHVTGDEFRSKVLCFCLLGLPFVHFAFLGGVFCLDFDF
jgi:hypothetical protein